MADLPALPAWANEHRVIIIYLFLCCFLLAHFSRWLRLYEPRVVLAFLALLMIVGAFGFVVFMLETVDILDVFLFLAVWGIALYIRSLFAPFLGLRRYAFGISIHRRL